MYSENPAIEKISQYQHMVAQISKLLFSKIGVLRLHVSYISIALTAHAFSLLGTPQNFFRKAIISAPSIFQDAAIRKDNMLLSAAINDGMF